MTNYSKEEITAPENVFLGNLFMWYYENDGYKRISIQNESIWYEIEIWIEILLYFIVLSIS